MTEGIDNPKQRTLVDLLKGILSGTAELGFASLPALAAFAEFKQEKGWKEAAFAEWIASDPKALPLLLVVLEKVKEKLPEQARTALIVALGGVPQ